MPANASPYNTPATTRQRQREQIAQRLNQPPAISAEAARQDQLDRDQFEKQAHELSHPTINRPALITDTEIVKLREYRTGAGALDALVKITNKRLDYWTQVNGGGDPFDVMTPESRTLAAAFFAEHGVRLAGAPRIAPDNPLKPKPGADALIERSKTVLTTPATFADEEAAFAATVAEDAKALATKPATPPAPAPAAAPDHTAVLLTRATRATEDNAKQNAAVAAQIAALVAEVKGLRADLAKLPTAAPAGPAETYQEFIADTLVVGLDDKSFETTYKLRGPQYKTHGIRVWPEILPELGLDAATLKPGPHTLPKPLKVRALLVDGKLKKVVGLAK